MMTREEIVAAGHWADVWAAKVIRQRGEKELYTCASGITPSGTVHIGNFREIISVDLVYRALKSLGKSVRFIYSWDDYDVFRKAPKNMPNPELLETYLRRAIDAVPDTTGQYENYARANEARLEELLPIMGIRPEYIYQSKRYRAGTYAQGIRTALLKSEIIRAELNEFRTEPLPPEWSPISIFCEKCGRDATRPLSWNGEWEVSYACDDCGYDGSLDLRKTEAAKLPWRIDWPMRWQYEGVDFEPAGKDHHSQGGSFSTAEKTVREVYCAEPPVTFQYDFVRIKGGAGKISSSSGEVVDLGDCLKIYQPEVIRFLFVGTRPNSEFAVSFDLDVLKVYEDYDKCEREYYDDTPLTDPKKLKNRAYNARIYELSQIDEPSPTAPYRVTIRHLCNLLQIHSGDVDATLANLADLKPEQTEKLRERCRCALNWIEYFAPDDFKFKLRDGEPALVLDARESAIIESFKKILPLMETLPENPFAERVYAIAGELNLESATLFPAIYKAILGQEKGPRLINFLYTVGRSRLESILSVY